PEASSGLVPRLLSTVGTSTCKLLSDEMGVRSPPSSSEQLTVTNNINQLTKLKMKSRIFIVSNFKVKYSYELNARKGL
ncbi:hypothetical protein, partial [Acinetobacter baumannii]|uniref:hypothetical protein n=1 Tax=Acinetobacter baumannii TaxID=470 RepID=UPI003328B374